MALSVVKTLGLAVATSVAMATGAIAATFSFEGSYSDGGVQYFDFTVVQEPAEITIRTFEYAQGLVGRTRTETDGILSVVTLFDDGGTVVGSNDPAVAASLDPNLVDGDLGASPLVVGPLSLGSYTLAMEISDFMQNLGDMLYLGAMLCDGIDCQTEVAYRQADWAVDLNTTEGEISAVPLPAGLPLLAAGLVGFGVLRRRQKN